MRGPDFGPFQLTGESGIFRALITETASLPFADLPVSRLAGGDWTFERVPTETFAGFQQTFPAPQPLRLKTDQISAVRRNEPLTIEWENHGYSSNDGVTVTMNVCERPIGPVHGCLPGAGLGAFPNNTHGRFVEDPC